MTTTAPTDATPLTDLDFVDADGHIVEPPFGLQDYAPAEFRDRVYHLEIDDDGEEFVVIGDARMAANVFTLTAAGGFSEEEKLASHKGELKFSEMTGGCWNVGPRLADMDRDRISESVLYPTLLLSFQSQHPLDLVIAQCQAYNDWLTDHVAESGGRLHGVAVLPQRDPEAAAAEIRRVAGRPGIVGVQVRPNPVMDWKPFNDPVYDPLWRAASEAGLPVGFHPLMSADLPGAVQGLRLGKLGTSAVPVQDEDDMAVDNIFFTQMIGNPVDMMNTLTFLVAGGVLTRFPDLKVAFLETNGGWIVPWLERMDHTAKEFPWDVPWLKEEPSAIFRRQCWISFDADESTLAFTASSPLVGADRIIWATDYPHPDAKIPGCTAELVEALSPLPLEQQRLIAGGNARSLYGI
ncbi:MAG TPA: amidohydrolase family protein [Acidimicrobiales bacterium]|jgi:predicted TIM-barrel fold metal-dependent hydrolase|nr:amidohydrolase family protein [Acidimicrobiales bacterium]